PTQPHALSLHDALPISVALHYAAWKKYRLAMQYELDRRERFLPLMLSLSGVGLDGLRDRLAAGEGAVFDQAIAHYAGAVRQRPVDRKSTRLNSSHVKIS